MNPISLSLHPNQMKIFKDQHRFKVVVCGRRFGKTWLAITTMIIRGLEKPNGLFWYISPTYRQSKQIAWEMLISKIRTLPKQLLISKNETNLSVTIGNNTRIELKGADNEDSLRGVGLDGVIMDEYASMKPKVFEEIIRPTLIDTGGWAMFIGTPKGFNHFYDLYSTKDPDYGVFHFVSKDNPYLPAGDIDKAKTEMTEDSFAQEFNADFRKFTGLVYKDFDRNKNVIDPRILDLNWSRYIGVDFGYDNPTAVVFMCMDNDNNWYVYDEISQREAEISRMVESIKGRTVGVNITGYFADPSGKQIIAEYQKQGIPLVGGNNEVIGGIAKVNELIRPSEVTGQPKLKVFRNCTNTIKEFESYHYAEKKDTLNTKETPVKENDHLLDALRYVIFTYSQPTNTQDYESWEPRKKI